MDDLLTGYVYSVASGTVGTQTDAAALSGSSTLVLDDVIDFAPTGGQVSIDGTVLDYLEADDDESTLTLALPLTATVAEGAEVLVYPPKFEVTALVLIDGASDPIPATVPWDKQDALKPGIREEEDREKVTLRRDGEWSWVIADLPDQPLERDAVYSVVPAVSAFKGSDMSVPNSTWTLVTGWFSGDGDRVTLDGFTHRFQVQVDGVFDVRCGVSFASNSTNRRALRIHFYYAGTDSGVSRNVSVGADGVTGIETAQYRPLYAGTEIAFEVWQNSGGALDLKGSDAFSGPPLTDCAIRWVGPLK